MYYFGRDLESMSFAPNYHRWILNQFRPFIGKHLLEVGAGTGTFSQGLLALHPYSLTLLEPSDNMFPLLEKNLSPQSNLTILKVFFSQIYHDLPNPIDTLFYVNVLEHIQEDVAELHYAHQALQSGGHLCLFVPALSWLFGTADENVGHVRRYHKKPLERLVQRAGFTIVQSNYFDIVGILPWWVCFSLLRLQAVKSNQARLYDTFVVPLMQRIESTFSVPIGKNILLIGRKS